MKIKLQVEKVWDLKYYGEVILIPTEQSHHFKIELSPKHFKKIPKEGDKFEIEIKKIN